MKCTWVSGSSKCEKETGKPLPYVWQKHKEFDPRTLNMFFKGTVFELYLPLLINFVCPDCMPKYKQYLRDSERGQRGAQTRKLHNQLNSDYSI